MTMLLNVRKKRQSLMILITGPRFAKSVVNSNTVIETTYRWGVSKTEPHEIAATNQNCLNQAID